MLIVVAAAFAVVDWWAVGSDTRPVELVAKPATMTVLVALAATWGDAPSDVRTWLVVGAVFGLAGDVALLVEGGSAFMVGLGAFACGHLAYVVAAVSVGFDLRWAVVGAVLVAALLSFRFLTRTLPGARAHGGPVLAAAVVFYAVVIAAMVVTAWGTARWAAAAGAALFAISDWVLGHRRFAGPLPGGRVAVHVPYHVGQALLILAIASG
jgi:uncharacterized membrane protein YhhN